MAVVVTSRQSRDALVVIARKQPRQKRGPKELAMCSKWTRVASDKHWWTMIAAVQLSGKVAAKRAVIIVVLP